MTETKQKEQREAPAEQVPDNTDALVAKVRQRYGRIAEGRMSGCCSPVEREAAEQCTAERIGYDETELAATPDGANLGLGCGAPIRHLDLEPGEVVLDLGSGGGLDAFLAAEQVGASGRVIGVDMTPQMIERARDNASKAGLTQVEFRQGRLERLPVEDASIDAVTSNCVINLVPDKRQVFGEIQRVLKPGGRLVVSDIVLDGELPEVVERDLMAYVGCVAGAMRRETYFASIEQAGLGNISVLKDVDFLATVGAEPPEELVVLMQRTGVRLEQLEGKVRSVTFRADKV
jgi:SAM-dependent methyltransferase